MSGIDLKGANGDELLTTVQAAKLLGVSDSSIRRYIEAGQLPAMRLPTGVYRVPRSAVDEYLRQLQEGD